MKPGPIGNQCNLRFQRSNCTGKQSSLIGKPTSKYGGISEMTTGKVEVFEAKWFDHPESAVSEVTVLIDSGCDGVDGEFDAPCNALVEAVWPNVVEWECTQVSCFQPTGRVILHDLRVVLPVRIAAPVQSEV